MFEQRFDLVFENLMEFLRFAILEIEFAKLLNASYEEFKLL